MPRSVHAVPECLGGRILVNLLRLCVSYAIAGAGTACIMLGQGYHSIRAVLIGMIRDGMIP